VRQTGKVEVRMTVREPDGKLTEEVAHFVGPAPVARVIAEQKPPVGPAEPPPDLSKLKAELERLRELERQKAGESQRSRSIQFKPPAPITRQIDVRLGRGPAITPDVQGAGSGPPIQQSVIIPPAPAAPAPPPQPVKQFQQRPASGRAIWTGQLGRGGLVLIDPQRASVGTINGPLPQRPARLRVYPADLRDSGIVVYTNGARPDAIEPPSAANGWNLTEYNADPRRSRAITVLEYPSRQNDWKRLLIRSEERTVSILVIDWEEIPASEP
jgi:hypothetical protein